MTEAGQLLVENVELKIVVTIVKEGKRVEIL